MTAAPPQDTGDELTLSRHTPRRRRPASGAEADRRRRFGQVFGQANAEAGRKVREERAK